MTYNGHPSYNYWNVSLWVGNDEGLYHLALDSIKHTKNRKQAAEAMLDAIKEAMQLGAIKGKQEHYIPTTPDGAPYTVASLIHAMSGLVP